MIAGCNALTHDLFCVLDRHMIKSASENGQPISVVAEIPGASLDGLHRLLGAMMERRRTPPGDPFVRVVNNIYRVEATYENSGKVVVAAYLEEGKTVEESRALLLQWATPIVFADITL